MNSLINSEVFILERSLMTPLLGAGEIRETTSWGFVVWFGFNFLFALC